MTGDRKLFTSIFGKRDPVTGKRKRKPRLMIYSMMSFIGFSVLISIAWPVMLAIGTLLMALLDSVNSVLSVIMGIFLMILYLCAILTFIWIFAYLLKQKVMEPINRLTTGLREITSGDRTARLTGRINVEFEEMQDAFNYMAGQLEEADNAKRAYERERSMIFSNISHDLKTPISTIAGYAGALSDGLVTDESKKDEYLRAIRTKALHMNELVELLFEYSRLDNPGYEIRREKLELTELLRSVIATMYGEFENQSITLDIDLPDESVGITGDRLELSRAVTNLLNNAILHNGPGRHVRICLARISGTPEENAAETNGTVPVAGAVPMAGVVPVNGVAPVAGVLSNHGIASKSGSNAGARTPVSNAPNGGAGSPVTCWEIQISDDGDAIPEELASRLFTPFVVGDESRSTRGGSGLGLAITRKIIERHGGCAILRQGPEGYTKSFAILLPEETADEQPENASED